MKRKGFTLIELLAVIIILGILMLIAIPSVTTYINNSRKETYVDTIKELIKGATIKVNSGELSDISNPDTTYYLPCTCISTENGEASSPYGKFNPAYIVVTYDGDNYNYYFTGKDVSNMGVPYLTKSDLLSKESIVSNIESINTTVGIDGKNKIVVYNNDCSEAGTPENAVSHMSGEGDDFANIICKRVKNEEDLHSETCQTSVYQMCGYLGYERGSKITYGSIWDGSGTPKSGDAFDCNVDGTGYNQRFYYVSKYFDKSTLSFDESTAALMYYANTYNGEPSTNGAAYNSTNDNYYGPVTAVTHLPTTTQWSNITLKSDKRAIFGESNTTHHLTTTSSRSLPSNFSYEGHAARLMTADELYAGCKISSMAYVSKCLMPCIYMFENLKFGTFNDNNPSSFWVEEVVDQSYAYVWSPSGEFGYVSNHGANNLEGVRPVIDVPISKIK